MSRARLPAFQSWLHQRYFCGILDTLPSAVVITVICSYLSSCTDSQLTGLLGTSLSWRCTLALGQPQLQHPRSCGGLSVPLFWQWPSLPQSGCGILRVPSVLLTGDWKNIVTVGCFQNCVSLHLKIILLFLKLLFPCNFSPQMCYGIVFRSLSE